MNKFGVFKLLAACFGALSLSKFIVRWFDVGLMGICEDLLDFYSLIVGAVFGFIPALLNLEIPSEILDLWVISGLGAAAYIRAVNPPDYDFRRSGEDQGWTAQLGGRVFRVVRRQYRIVEDLPPVYEPYWRVLVKSAGTFLWLWISGVGAFLLLSIPLAGLSKSQYLSFSMDEHNFEMSSARLVFVLELVLILALCALFFAVNAYAPSLGAT